MYQIRDWLYVGKYSQTRNLLTLNQYGINAMLQLADYVPQENIETLFLNVDDGEPLPAVMIERGLTFLREQKDQNQTILVACGAGISRSSTFALAFLMQEENLSLLEAYREVYKNHPQAEPHPELIKSLYAYHGETKEMIEVYSALQTVRQDVDKDNA